MATFEAQVEGLTSLSIDGSSAPTQTELTQFLTDGAKEILSVIPKQKRAMYSTPNTLDASNTTLTIGGSEVLGVTRNDGTIDQPCRRIPLTLSGRAQDSSEMIYATTSDPVWWITSNALNMFPTPTNSQTSTVQTLAYPAVAYGDSAITRFPDEAEYLVPIYASIKAIQNALGAKAGNSDITTALGALKQSITNAGTEIGLAKTEAAEIAAYTDTASGSNLETAADGIATAVAKFQADGGDPALFGDETQYKTGDGLTRVNTALDVAISYINGNYPNAAYDLAANLADVDSDLTSEDIELASGRIKQAQTTLSAVQAEINIAQAHIADWNAAVNALQSEISGFSSEVSSRAALVSTKVQAVQSYAGTANAYLSQASGNAAEIQSRLSVLTTEYTWLEKQQAKLQADYDKGLQMVAGA
jgi:hypothetical protein